MLKKEKKNTSILIIYSFYTCIKCFKWKFPFLVLDSPGHGLTVLFQSFIGTVAAGFQTAFCPLLILSLIRFQLFCWRILLCSFFWPLALLADYYAPLFSWFSCLLESMFTCSILVAILELKGLSWSAMSDSVTPGTWPSRILCLWNFQIRTDKNTGVGSHSLLQEIFANQGSNPGFLHCRQILYHLSHQGSPIRIGRRSLNYKSLWVE